MPTPASCLMMLLYSSWCSARALLVHVSLLYEVAGDIDGSCLCTNFRSTCCKFGSAVCTLKNNIMPDDAVVGTPVHDAAAVPHTCRYLLLYRAVGDIDASHRCTICEAHSVVVMQIGSAVWTLQSTRQCAACYKV